MATRNYPAIIFREEGEEAWSILFPDFPEVASSAETARDVHSQALDALRTVVDLYAEENRALPESTDIDRALDLAREQNAVAAFYGVELPAPERVNISMDRTLLTRIDAAADARGMTRSGFLAAAARKELA